MAYLIVLIVLAWPAENGAPATEKTEVRVVFDGDERRRMSGEDRQDDSIPIT